MARPSDPLVAAIELLAKNVAAQTEWLKSHAGAVTRKDLRDAEDRIRKAIEDVSVINPKVEAAAKRLGTALDKLDATIPDKQ